MAKKTLHKDIFKTILQSKGRFLSILFLAMLGSFGLVGLKTTGPDINYTVQHIVHTTNMSDLTVIGELGISQDDVDELNQIQHASVEFGYFKDVTIQGTTQATRIFSQLPTISTPIVISGQLPKSDNDIALSQTLQHQYRIGDVITFDEHGSQHILKQKTFTITGFIASSDYISNTTLGSATAGSGTLSSYAVVSANNFDSSAYTIARIKYTDLSAYNTYSNDYDTIMTQRQQQLEQQFFDNSYIRLNSVKVDATQEISKNKSSVDEAQQQLDEAQQKLDNAQKEIESNQQLLTEKEKEIVNNDTLLKHAKLKLDQSKETLNQTKLTLDDAKIQLDSGKTQLTQTKQQLDHAKGELDTAYQLLKDKEQLLTDTNTDLEQAKRQLDDGKAQFNDSKKLYEQAEALFKSDPNLALMLGITQQMLEDSKKELDTKEKLLLQKETEYTDGMAQYENGLDQLKTGQQSYDSQLIQYNDGVIQYEQAKQLLGTKENDYLIGLAKYNDGLATYEKAYHDYQNGLKALHDGKAQLQDALLKLEEAIKTLHDNKETFESEKSTSLQKINEAQNDIDEASAKVDALKLPKYSIYTRGTMLGSEGFTTIKATSEGISAVGNLFPIVLYAVAALVSLTTMTRFVSEERLNSGLLKALGYSKKDIYKKFVIYGFVSSLVGAIIGVLSGTYILPKLLGNTLLANTILPQIQLHFYADVSILAIVIAIGCTVLPAYLVTRKELNEHTAALLLPKPPANGSSILLEKIPFLWKKLSFTQKVTARNIFRYKQRMFMTIFGVAGSLALLFSGLGILSSLDGMASRQFDHIIQYDAIVSKNDYVSAKEQENINHLLHSEHISSFAPIFTQQLTQKIDGITNEQTITLLTFQQSNDFINLYDKDTKQPVQLSSNGIAITEKLATLLHVKKDDTITLTLNNDTVSSFKIDAIVEMYAGHFIFMTNDVYHTSTQLVPNANGYLVRMANKDTQSIQHVASRFMALNGIKAVVQNTAIIYQVKTLVSSLTRIMLILVVVSILLAIVILYNLNTINVSERIRELSTIKVLGFLNKEVTLYIYRETIILSFIGIILGILGGRILHRIIIQTVATPQMMFNAHIPMWVHIFPCVIMITLLLIIGYIINRQLKRVDMLEALKSVD